MSYINYTLLFTTNYKEPISKQNSIKIAKSLYKLFSALNNQLPDLSPNQIKWLKAKMMQKHKTFAEIKILDNSDEYEIYSLKKRIEPILEETHFIAYENCNLPIQRINTWLLLTSNLISSNTFDLKDMVNQLVQKNIINPKKDDAIHTLVGSLNSDQILGMNFENSLARSIIDHIVLPLTMKT
ncbi:MAG: hypothetical protein PVI75_07945 [Gammaproteobacteria bacterium]|jgi:hypothetical protein